MQSSGKFFHILILFCSIIYLGQTQTIKGCLSMYSNNTCKTCNSDYNWKLKSGKCQCSDGFTNPPGCSACLKPYSPGKDSSSSSDSSNKGGKKCQKIKSKWDLKKRLKCGFCPDCDTTQGFKTSQTAMKCECRQGFFSSGSKCQPCSSTIPGCSKCSSSTSCSSCLPAAFYWDNTAKTCKACSINLPGCSTCSSPSSCSICSQGYVKNGVSCNACNDTMDGCTSCKPGSSFICLSCNISGNFQNVTGRCVCKSGFVKRNKTCISCVQAYPGCTQCKFHPNGSDYCQSCDQTLKFVLNPIFVGVYLNQTQCSCQPAHLSIVQQCVLCDFTVAGCIECSQTDGCTKCNDLLYFLQTPNSSTGLCDCISTYGKNDLNECKPCSQLFVGCLTCSGSPLVCDSCQQSHGYFNNLSLNNSCQPCSVTGCSDCRNNINVCDICDTLNYDLLAQQSVFNGISRCGPCDLQSDYDPNQNYLCIPCSQLNSEGCNKCEDGHCQNCISGYYLQEDNHGYKVCKLCRKTNPGCQNCDMLNPNICTTCLGTQNFSNELIIQSPDVKCKCLDETYYIDQGTEYPLCLKCSEANQVQHCLKCSSKQICLQCQNGYFLLGSVCKQCNDNDGQEYCTSCNISGGIFECLECQPGYFIDGSPSICVQCINQFCDKCDNTGTVCISCKQFPDYNFDQNPDGSQNCICKNGFTKQNQNDDECKINCTDHTPGCIMCQTTVNVITCTTCSGEHFDSNIVNGLCICQSGYTLVDKQCVSCSEVQPQCVQCTSEGKCLSCIDGLKPDPNSFGMDCIQCDEGCAICTDTDCITAEIGYFIDNNGDLLQCQQFGNCSQCTPALCIRCITQQYALNYDEINHTCILCNQYSTLSGCLYCLNSTFCSQCDSAINFMPDGNGKCICQDTFAFDGNNCGSCESFMDQCLNCLDNDTCIQCDIGFQIDSSNNHCKPCSIGCLICDPEIGCFGCNQTANFKLNNTDTTCYCEDGYALTVDKKCETVCGDGIFMPSFENCDDGNNNDGDGCSSTCLPEYDWSCSNRQFMKSICGFQGIMAIQFQNVTKNPLSNQVTLTFSVGPTLQGLKTIDFTAAFSSNLKLSNPTYVYNPDGTVSLTYDYYETLEGQEAQFTFNPSLASSAFYAVDPISSKLKMSTNNNQPITYYNPQTYTQVPKFRAAFMAGQAFSYAILIGGMFCDKIIGIQLFGVWQIAFFAMSNIDYIQPLLSPLLDFKSLNGYNFGFCSNCEPVPMRINAIRYKSQISNNFNVMLIVLLLEASVALILFGVSKLISSFSEKLANISQKMLKQYLLMITLFNTLNIGYSIGIQVTYGNAQPLDIVISVFSVLFLIGSAVGLSFTQKQGYGQFQNFFRRDWMSQFYFQYTIAYRFSLGILMSQLNQISSVTIFSFFLATAFLMYQMVNLPYKAGYQNYRAMFHQVSAVVIIGISMYYRSMKANEPVNISSTVLSPAYLQMLTIYSCIGMSAGVLLYELYHKYFKQWIQNIQQYIKNRPQPAKQVKTVQSQIIGQADNTFDKNNIFWTQP